jgi:hypothetical protein
VFAHGFEGISADVHMSIDLACIVSLQRCLLNSC